MDKVKRAGDILASVFRDQFDTETLENAKAAAGLFSAWENITSELKIPSAAAHSRIRELERGVLLIESEHPGWVQLFQTKQKQLLYTVQRRFPELNIEGVSFCLSRDIITPAPVTRKAPTESDGQSSSLKNAGGSSGVGAVETEPVLTEQNRALYESVEKLKKVLRKRNKKYPDSSQ